MANVSRPDTAASDTSTRRPTSINAPVAVLLDVDQLCAFFLRPATLALEVTNGRIQTANKR